MKKSLLIAMGACAAASLARASLSVTDTNYVGYSSVSVSGEYTVLAVPYAAYLDNAGNIALDKLVNTNTSGLTASDTAASASQLIVYQGGTYTYFYLSSTGWQTLQTVTAGATNSSPSASISTVKLEMGAALWLKQPTGAGTVNVLLQGQVAAAQATTIATGLNLVGSGYPNDLYLNSTTQTWPNDVANDAILVPKSDGTYTTYAYYDGAWKIRTYGQIGTIAGFPKYGFTYSDAAAIPVGTGFWYQRKGTTSFTFNPAN